jgi:hypothetical protein
MNPTAIFSKSGKGVQEASGKTSQLSRGDRAVLSAIDGRATLGDVAHKVGKQFDGEFRGLINKLDKDGFIREVSPGAAGPAPKGGAAAKPAAPSKPTAPMDMASDLDFTAAMAVPKKGGAAAPPPQTVARTPAPAPKPTVAVPPKPPPPSAAEQVKQTQIAKEQQSAFAKAREEAERKQQEDRDRVKSEAEAKVRAETEAKLREEAEEKAKADAEAKAKKAEADAAAARSSAIRAAAEAKVKAEAEAKRAREEAERHRQEAERAKREAEEMAERARREAEEKARREQEELKRKLEEERRAREEAERKAKEEAERARRELEEERRKIEEERKQREEESRREEEERTARKREEEEEKERRKQRAEEEERERAEKEEARQRENEQSLAKMMEAQSAPPPPPPAPPKAKPAAATGDAFADSLLADLDSFTQRDDEDRKAKEEGERKAKEEVARKRQEEVERAEREEAEARQRAEDERRRKEEEAQRVRDEEERRARKAREEQEQIEREAEERRRKVAAASGAAPAGSDDLGITDDDLEMDEVKREAALLEKKKNRKEEREKEREKERTAKKERDREAKSKKDKEKEEKESKKSAAAYSPRRRKSNLGRNVAAALFVLLIIGAGVVHVMPVSTGEYETAASEALGRPVKIRSGNFSLIGGVQFKFEGVTLGDLAVPTVRAFPEIGSVFGDRKVFSRIELDGMTLPQDALGEALFGKARGENFHVARVVAKNLKLAGALPLPPLEIDAQLESGGVRTAVLRGPEGLVAKLAAKESSIEFDVSSSQLTLPFASGITLVQFAMKGDATRSGMKISQWDGLLYSGHMTGTANVRWGNTWSVDGVLTARGLNAAVFAPALLSNGRGEGTGRFTMSGVEPAKLGASGRLEGSFTVTKGVLGSFDLSRALQTGGRQFTGQTHFAEMSGQGVYDRGAVSLRNITLGAGALNAGASIDVAEGGALSGRIVADVKTSTQNLRATLTLGGTVQEPLVRN